MTRSASGIVGFTRRATTPPCGISSDSSSSRLDISSMPKVTPVALPPGFGQAGDQPVADRIGAAHEDNWNIRGRAYRSQRGRYPARRDDQVGLAANEVERQCGQPIIAAVRPAVFDRDALSLGVPGFAQPLAE